MRSPSPRGLALVAAASLLTGCGTSARPHASGAILRSLLREARPIGSGPRFQPPARGPILGRCQRRLGRRSGVHVEVFAQNRVVLMPAGIGTRAPRTITDGQVTAARCYGALVTLAPTGVVLVRAHSRLTLAQLFRSWGEPLTNRQLASFNATAGQPVLAFLDGRRWSRPPGAIPLARHAEIVLEVGPYVPPHKTFAFPPGI